METSSNQKTYALFSTPLNRKLIAGLEENGAKVFQFAPVETRRIDAETNSEIIRNNLTEFDWIIFPDVFAVDYFLEILEENEIDLFELDASRVLAFGEVVADRLRFVQLHADIIPHSMETETVFSTLVDYLGKEDFSALKFLLPSEIAADFDLKRKLIDAKADVTEIGLYQVEIIEKNKTVNLKALLKGGAIDEIIVSSAEDIISLKHYLAAENLAEIFSDIKISGTNEGAMQSLRENNLRPQFFQNK
jgi:uroporphyrinogen-III synthase